MGQSALLEREYQTSVQDENNTPEAIEHRRRGHEVYNDFFRSTEYDAEKVTAAYSMGSPSAKASAAEAPARSALFETAPAFASAPATAQAPVRKELFSNLEYKDHTLIRTDVKEEVATPAPEAVPSFSPVDVPETAVSEPETEENEDLRPTQRTMDTLQREEIYRRTFDVEEYREEHVGFFASLSSKTKMVLAIISALFVVAIALVCINTGIINSIKSDLTSKQEELRGLAEYSEELVGRIDEVTDPAFVDQYAENELGMTRS